VIDEETGERVRGATERAQRAAIEIYERCEAERERTPVDRAVAAEFRSRRYLNSGERRWISEVVYSCVRYQRRLDWLLERLERPRTAENRVRLWMAAPVRDSGVQVVGVGCSGGQEQGLPATAPSEEAEAKPGKVILPTGVTEEALEAALAALPGPEQLREYVTISLSFPDDMADALVSQLGDEAAAAAAAFNTQAPTILRVNPLRVSRGHLQKSLPEATPTRFSPWGLELSRRVNVHDLPGYRTGWFEVQEEASQLAALLTDAQPGQTVVDVGAGAGGKTLAIAALMENRGSILALDTNETRLEELKRRAERGGVTCVETLRVGADETGKWQPTSTGRRTINRVVGKADVVLVDAPCTGSGVLRRSPDTKWRELYRPELLQLQAKLLEQAALLTAPGGHLIYVTCAYERDQNEEVVAAFLKTDMGGQFVVEPVAQRLIDACERAVALALAPPSLRSAKARRAQPTESMLTENDAVGGDRDPRDEETNTLATTREDLAYGAALRRLTDGPYLRTWPHRDGLDAFFAACLRRSSVMD
jgi:16S rRNA (cytosine967-C5)-methyltransferase